MSLFTGLKTIAEDPILGLNKSFVTDKRINKINLGIGTYKDSKGHPLVMKAVSQAEDILANARLDKDYGTIDGDQEFLDLISKEILPSDNSANFFKIQTVAGTGALYLGAQFLKNFYSTVILPGPTWGNHHLLFKTSNFEIKTCEYLNEDNSINIKSFQECLSSAPERSIIVLQLSCHNPTGIDPTLEEWQILSKLIKENNIFPFFDCAYHGFGPEGKESEILNIFLNDHHDFFLSYSCSKNFCLYSERTGMLLGATQADSSILKEHLKKIVRASYSVPPCHGARIVKTILKSQELRTLWKEELSFMAKRINQMRSSLSDILPDSTTGNGMFTLSNLPENKIIKLKNEFGIYFPLNSRLNIAGLNEGNINFFKEAFRSIK